MTNRAYGAAILMIAVAVSGCMTTQEMPLAPNVVRLDTHASGLISTSMAPGETMRRAAQITLQNGYTHFRFEDASTAQGSQYAGTYSTANGTATATAFGNTAFASGTETGFSVPIYRRTSDIGVTVVMFHANEPGAKNAFDAAEVLKKYGQ